MIVTSTNEVAGYRVSDYLGLVNANIVIGTNVISDFIAGLSDFFGGESGTYKSKLDGIYERALNELRFKASRIGANAILGVHFDFDEISGGGKSMFMVTTFGTAVKIMPDDETGKKNDRYEIYQKLYNLTKFKDAGIITAEQYETEKANLLLSHESEIEDELKSIRTDNEQKEAIKKAEILSQKLAEERRREEEIKQEQKRKEEEARMTEQERQAALRKEKEIVIRNAIEKFKTNAPAIFVQVRNILDLNIKSPKFTLDNLSYNQIANADYKDMDINPSDKLAYTIGRFIKEDRIAEACKFYIDTVNDDDIQYAKSYVYSVYDIITFKKQSAFEIMALNLVELKYWGKEEEAIDEFMKYSICNRELAKQVIDLL